MAILDFIYNYYICQPWHMVWPIFVAVVAGVALMANKMAEDENETKEE